MILLNPTYESMRAALSTPEQLIAQGTPIHRGRNELAVVEVKGVRLCIKRYGLSNPLRRFIYRYLRAPKGLRALQNAMTLRAAGFESPEPVAYIERHSVWGIEDSYYICLYEDGQTLYRWGDRTINEIKDEVVSLGQWTAQLHEAGLLLLDFTPGNILCSQTGFALVDTNRMKQGKITIRQGLKNMAGLWLQPEAAALLATTYAASRGAKEPEQYVPLFAQYRRCFWRRFVRRHGLHDLIVHRDLDGSSYTYHFNETIR